MVPKVMEVCELGANGMQTPTKKLSVVCIFDQIRLPSKEVGVLR